MSKSHPVFVVNVEHCTEEEIQGVVEDQEQEALAVRIVGRVG